MNNSPICIDANILIQLVRTGAEQSELYALWKSWCTAKRSITAPTLLYYELVNALRRAVIHGVMQPEDADETLQAAFYLPISLYGDAALHRRALALAGQYSLPAAYDAHYVALAERLNAEFWTADQRLYRVLRSTLPWVHIVGEDEKNKELQ